MSEDEIGGIVMAAVDARPADLVGFLLAKAVERSDLALRHRLAELGVETTTEWEETNALDAELLRSLVSAATASADDRSASTPDHRDLLMALTEIAPDSVGASTGVHAEDLARVLRESLIAEAESRRESFEEQGFLVGEDGHPVLPIRLATDDSGQRILRWSIAVGVVAGAALLASRVAPVLGVAIACALAVSFRAAWLPYSRLLRFRLGDQPDVLAFVWHRTSAVLVRIVPALVVPAVSGLSVIGTAVAAAAGLLYSVGHPVSSLVATGILGGLAIWKGPIAALLAVVAATVAVRLSVALWGRWRAWPAPVERIPRRQLRARAVCRPGDRALKRGLARDASAAYEAAAERSTGAASLIARRRLAYALVVGEDYGRALEVDLPDDDPWSTIVRVRALLATGDRPQAQELLSAKRSPDPAGVERAHLEEVGGECEADARLALAAFTKAADEFRRLRHFHDVARVARRRWERAAGAGLIREQALAKAQHDAVMFRRLGNSFRSPRLDAVRSLPAQLVAIRFRLAEERFGYADMSEGGEEWTMMPIQLEKAGLALEASAVCEALARAAEEGGHHEDAAHWAARSFALADAYRYRFLTPADRGRWAALSRSRAELAALAALRIGDHELLAEVVELARTQTLPKYVPGDESSASATLFGLQPPPKLVLGGDSRLFSPERSGDLPLNVSVESTLKSLGGDDTWLLSFLEVGSELVWSLVGADGSCSGGSLDLSSASDLRRALDQLDDWMSPSPREGESPFDHALRVRNSPWFANAPSPEATELDRSLGALLIPSRLRSALRNCHGTATLLIQPTAAIGAVPFGFLGLFDDGLVRVMEHARVVIVPGLSLIHAVATDHDADPHPLSLVVADTGGDLESAAEAAALAVDGTTLIGSAGLPATRANVLDALDRAEPASTALVAGHHDAAADTAGSGGIRIAGPAAENAAATVLTSADVIAAGTRGLRVPNRILLSCCDSVDISSGTHDEWLGIAPALISAGATQVLGAVVDLKDGPELSSVERELVAALEHAGDPVERVRRVQLDHLDRWRNADPSAVAPAYWATFSVVGLPGTTQTPPSFEPTAEDSLFTTLNAAHLSNQRGRSTPRPITTADVMGEFLGSSNPLEELPLVVLFVYYVLSLVLSPFERLGARGRWASESLQQACANARDSAHATSALWIREADLLEALMRQRWTSGWFLWLAVPPSLRRAIIADYRDLTRIWSPVSGSSPRSVAPSEYWAALGIAFSPGIGAGASNADATNS